jgi:hypothetical protein
MNRSLRDRAAIDEGVDLLERSIHLGTHRPVGIYQLQAAIAALHAQADSPAHCSSGLQWVHVCGSDRPSGSGVVAERPRPLAGVLWRPPTVVALDNLKSGVTKACSYDPDLNPSYLEWARILRRLDLAVQAVPPQGQGRRGGRGTSRRAPGTCPTPQAKVLEPAGWSPKRRLQANCAPSQGHRT